MALAPHFTVEWAIEFHAALQRHVQLTLPELTERWPLLAGGWRFDAYEVSPDHVALTLHPTGVRFPVAGPSVPIAIPGSSIPATSHDALWEWVAAAIQLPGDAIMVLLPSRLPTPRNLKDDEWDTLRPDWDAQVGKAFVRLLVHVANTPPISPTATESQSQPASEFFELHPSFPSPADPDSVIWRYMSTAKLIDVLRRAALWFARLDLLGDPFEGSLAARNVLVRNPPSAETTTVAPPPLTVDVRERYFVSCWHMSAYESAAMWSIYAPNGDGVSIKTTFRRLVEGLAGPEHFQAGLVSYADYGSAFIPEDNSFERVMHKRKSFEHEREVRAVIARWDASERPTGFYVPFDISTLEAVYVAPNAPDWFLETIKELCARFCPGLVVLRSDMDRDPIL